MKMRKTSQGLGNIFKRKCQGFHLEQIKFDVSEGNPGGESK